MASGAVESRVGQGNPLATLADRVRGEGSGSHPYLSSRALRAGPEAARNLADVVHILCALHGRHPGLADIAADRAAGPARAWLEGVAQAFAVERARLLRLVVEAGPMPSTPRHAECEAAIAGQRHALEMLAMSDRQGCALGAVAGLVGDWTAIRDVLDLLGERLGLDPVPRGLPAIEGIAPFAAEQAASPAFHRAVGFGAQQLLVQHRGLWDLIESRQQARQSA